MSAEPEAFRACAARPTRRARVAAGVAPERLGPFRVLLAEGQALFASRGLELFVSHDAGGAFQRVGVVPVGLARRALARCPWSARLLREGFHDLVRRPGGELVGVIRGAIVAQSAGEPRFRVAHRVERGTRPLGLCLAPSGRLFYGEYFGNPRRDEVRVWGSDDGRAWEVVHTFPRGTIRHVHGIHADPHRGGLWVLTGDAGDEAGIWWTADDFRTLEPVVLGTQRARAVTLLPLEAGLLVPMDSPEQQNHVQLFHPESGRFEDLAPVPGSVFHAARTPGLFAVASVVEPSRVNRDRRVALLVSRDGCTWRVACRLAPDLRLDGRGRLLYPTLVLPRGTAAWPCLFATGQALAGAHGRLLRWSEDELCAAAPHRKVA